MSSINLHHPSFSLDQLDVLETLLEMFKHQQHDYTDDMTETDGKNYFLAMFVEQPQHFIDLVNGKLLAVKEDLQKKFNYNSNHKRARAYSKAINTAKNTLERLGFIKLYKKGTSKYIEETQSYKSIEKLKLVESILAGLLTVLQQDLTELDFHNKDILPSSRFQPERIQFTLQDVVHFLSYLDDLAIPYRRITSSKHSVTKALHLHLGSTRGGPTIQKWYPSILVSRNQGSEVESLKRNKKQSHYTRHIISQLHQTTSCPEKWDSQLCDSLKHNPHKFFEVIYGSSTSDYPSAAYFFTTLLKQELKDVELVFITKKGINNPLKVLDYDLKHGKFYSKSNQRLGLYQLFYHLQQHVETNPVHTGKTNQSQLPLLVGLEIQPQTRYLWEVFNLDKVIPTLRAKSTWTDHTLIQQLTPKKTLVGPITVKYFTLAQAQQHNLLHNLEQLKALDPSSLSFPSSDKLDSTASILLNASEFESELTSLINFFQDNKSKQSIWKQVERYQRIIATLRHVQPNILSQLSTVHFDAIFYHNYYYNGDNGSTLAQYLIEFITHTIKISQDNKTVQIFITKDFELLEEAEELLAEICDSFPLDLARVDKNI